MITEKDFIDKMVEIAKDGYEYMDQLQCIFLHGTNSSIPIMTLL